jgi:hypothetical protein
MKNRKLQLEVLKSLIKEEVKKQFFLSEDVTSDVASVDASAAVKLGTPELVVQKSQDGSGLTVYINNVNGYKSFSLSGFDDYIKIIPVITKKGGSDNYIKVVYAIETTSTKTIAQMLINSMNFKIKTNPTDKSINLELYYDFKEHAKYNVRNNFDINKDLRQSVLHGVNHRTDEKLDIYVPVSITFKGKLA